MCGRYRQFVRTRNVWCDGARFVDDDEPRVIAVGGPVGAPSAGIGRKPEQPYGFAERHGIAGERHADCHDPPVEAEIEDLPSVGAPVGIETAGRRHRQPLRVQPQARTFRHQSRQHDLQSSGAVRDQRKPPSVRRRRQLPRVSRLDGHVGRGAGVIKGRDDHVRSSVRGAGNYQQRLVRHEPRVFPGLTADGDTRRTRPVDRRHHDSAVLAQGAAVAHRVAIRGPRRVLVVARIRRQLRRRAGR